MADKTLTDALLEARRAMKDPRMSGSNPHFKSKFVPRDQVLDAVVSPLLAAGVVLTQGIFDGMLATQVHGYGEVFTLGEYPLPDQSDPQKYLAACTYASRGSLMLAFALAGDDDDDGNTAARKAKGATPEQITELREHRVELDVTDDVYGAQLEHYGVSVDTDLTSAQAEELLGAYRKKLASTKERELSPLDAG